jgi:hypothetical protein
MTVMPIRYVAYDRCKQGLQRFVLRAPHVLVFEPTVVHPLPLAPGRRISC